MPPEFHSLQAGTHAGTFHADDVLALALLREFLEPEIRLRRTRDPEALAECDILFDVGGEHDPARGRFDHHQADYQGDRSSAGLILDWLLAEGRLDDELARRLRHQLVDYVDAVDNGRRTPEPGVPCFSGLIGSMTNERGDGSTMDERYFEAAAAAQHFVRGIRGGLEAERHARSLVREAMEQARQAGSRVIEFDSYLSWKTPYFENGGVSHPTDFVLFPADDRWRVVAIPPEAGSFDKKVPFPEDWAGLVDEELSRVIGVNGARFCHKNRFIAVFDSREAALESLRRWQLG